MFNSPFVYWAYLLFYSVLGFAVFYIIFVITKGCISRNLGSQTVAHQPPIFVVARDAGSRTQTGVQPSTHQPHMAYYNQGASFPPTMFPKDTTVSMPSAPPSYEEALNSTPQSQQSQVPQPQRAAS